MMYGYDNYNVDLTRCYFRYYSLLYIINRIDFIHG